jgi:hypothetical protein
VSNQLSVLKRRSLAFPGRAPGFDPSHPFGKSIQLSAVNYRGNFINFAGYSPVTGTVAGTTANKIDGIIGPCKDVGTTSRVTFAATAVATGSPCTQAAIIRTSTADNSGIIQNATAATDGPMLAVFASGGSNLSFSTGPTDYLSGIILADNTPYFLVASLSGLTNGTVNFLALNLKTGQITTATQAEGNDNSITGSGYTIGFDWKFSDYWQGRIAAVMSATKYYSLFQLTMWAADPWAFWYPYQDIDPQFFIMGGTQVAATTNFGWYNREKDERPSPIQLPEARQAYVPLFVTAKTPANWFPATNPDRERPPPIPRPPDEPSPWFAQSPNPVPTGFYPPTTGADRERLPPVGRSPDEATPFFVRSPNPVPTRWPPTTGADRERLPPIPRSPDEATPFFVRSPNPVPIIYPPTTGADRERLPPIPRPPDEATPWFIRSPVPVPIIWPPTTGADRERPPPIPRPPDEAIPFFRSPGSVLPTWLPTAGETEHVLPIPLDPSGTAWVPKLFVAQNTISGMAWHNPAADRERPPPIGRSPDEATLFFVRSPNPVPSSWLPTAGGDVDHRPDLTITDQRWSAAWTPQIIQTVTVKPVEWLIRARRRGRR